MTGVKLRMAECKEHFVHLAEELGCGVASLPDAKGLFRYDTPSL